jgi:hypothetical protein
VAASRLPPAPLGCAGRPPVPLPKGKGGGCTSARARTHQGQIHCQEVFEVVRELRLADRIDLLQRVGRRRERLECGQVHDLAEALHVAAGAATGRRLGGAGGRWQHAKGGGASGAPAAGARGGETARARTRSLRPRSMSDALCGATPRWRAAAAAAAAAGGGGGGRRRRPPAPSSGAPCRCPRPPAAVRTRSRHSLDRLLHLLCRVADFIELLHLEQGEPRGRLEQHEERLRAGSAEIASEWLLYPPRAAAGLKIPVPAPLSGPTIVAAAARPLWNAAAS